MKYDSPEKSPAFIRLAEYATSCGDENAPDIPFLNQFLWLINAHPELICFGLVCENINKILKILKELGITLQEDFSYLDKWSEIVAWLHSKENILGQEVDEEISHRPKSDGDNPVLNKGVGRHCLYGSLVNDHCEGRLREKFTYLVGIFFLAYTKTMKDHTDEEQFRSYSDNKHIHFPNSPGNAALALRSLSVETIPFIEDLKLEASIEELLDHCEKHYEAGSEDKEDEEKNGKKEMAKEEKILQKKIKAYAYFIAKSFGLRDWVNKTSGSGYDKAGDSGKRGRIPGYLISQESFDGTEDDATISSIQSVLRTPRKAKKDGLHPDETTDDNETLIFVGVPCRRAKKGSGRTAFAALGHARHTAMRNQILPWQQGQLTMTQLCNLLENCRNQYIRLLAIESWKAKDLLKAEIISLIHIMLWTASSVKQGTEICLPGERWTKDKLGLKIQKGSGTPEWLLPAFKPEYATNIIEDGLHTHKQCSYIILPDVRWGSFFILETDKRRSRPLFKKTIKYESGLKEFLQKIDPNVTPFQLKNFLFNYICRSTNDIALSCAVTNNYHSLAGVRAFYSTISLDKIKKTYSKAIIEVSKVVYEEMGHSFTPRPYDPDDTGSHVGARLLAKNEAVYHAIHKIRQLLEKKYQEDPIVDQEEFIKYHNYYTLYSVLFFSYVTACRGIISPYIPLHHIHAATGLSAIADKEGPEGNKSRLVWIPESLITQIDQYERHCEAVLFHWPELQKSRTEKREDCFFINEKIRCKTVRPKSIEAMMKKFLPLPANSHRKFMRMKLIESGCPHEIIDAYMGHWYYGEEPWGQFSSLSFIDYVDELKKHLVPIIEDQIDFKPVRSVLLKCI